MNLISQINEVCNRESNELSTENANKPYGVFPTQRDLLAGIASKYVARSRLPSNVVEAHDKGVIHYHDLDYSVSLPFTNCCLVDLKGMFENGFKLGNAEIETPKSIGVACAIMAQITAQVASHQYGGTTFANVDVVLEPYVEATYQKHLNEAFEWGISDFDKYAMKKTEKDVYDAFQAYEYEINTLFSSNGQTPFVTISFGTSTTWMGTVIQEAILKNRIKGLGKDGVTAIFPKLVFFIEEGINLKPEDPNYSIKKLALECSAKRMYPDIISSKINKEITGSSVPVSPMGCRSFLSVYKENGKEILDGRNNLGVVTLNLPRIALELGSDNLSKESYIQSLRDRLGLCYTALMTRIDSLRGAKASVAPILYCGGAFGVRMNPNDEILSLFKNGRSSISLGYIGLHETLKLIFNDEPFDNKEAQEFGKYILKEMNYYLSKWKEETGYAFSLYSTPAESLCHRFCKLDKAEFGSVKGITDKGWYTNSFHLDVERKVNPFEKIDFEKDYHRIATGGHISYVELPNMKDNLKALEQVWDYAVENLDYFGTNTPVDQCFTCDFHGEFIPTENGFKCPKCGEMDTKKMSVVRRTCGYLGNPASRGFNEGKQKEVIHRTKHIAKPELNDKLEELPWHPAAGFDKGLIYATASTTSN